MIAILCKWQIFCSFIDKNNLKLICINFNWILHPRFTHFITYVHDNITFENKICTLFKHEKIYFMFTLVIVNISIRRSIVNIYYTINSMRWTAFFNSKKTNPLSFYEKSNKSELDLACIFFFTFWTDVETGNEQLFVALGMQNANFIVRHASSICAIFKYTTVVKSRLHHELHTIPFTKLLYPK